MSNNDKTSEDVKMSNNVKRFNNVDGLFIETHFDPANAKSDGANMLHLDNLEGLLTNLVAIRKLVSSF